MPPGVVPTGHLREKTAILSLAGGGLFSMKARRFHAKSAFLRSPDQGLLAWLAIKVVQMEVVGACRRKRAGMVKRTMKKSVVHRLDREGMA